MLPKKFLIGLVSIGASACFSFYLEGAMPVGDIRWLVLAVTGVVAVFWLWSTMDGDESESLPVQFMKETLSGWFLPVSIGGSVLLVLLSLVEFD